MQQPTPVYKVWQFGGVGSIHLDYDLAPFVKMSFVKHFQDGLKYLENKSEYKIDRFKKCFELNDLSIEEHYKHYEDKGYEKKEIIKLIAKDRNVNKNEIYKLFI